MTPEVLAQLRALCRDEAAFDRLQAILADRLQPLERDLTEAQFKLNRQKALFEVITRLRSPLELEVIFQSTAAEVRQLLAADRVGMFRFDPDAHWNDGEFVSEDVDPDFNSAMATKIHDDCFGDRFAIDYQHGRVQAVTDIHSAGLSDCHIKILSQFQVRANLVVPLLQGENLWGLLCIHQCRAPREWDPTEIEFATQIAHHLGVALKHAELLAKLQAEIVDRQQAQHQAQELNQGLQQAIVELRSVNKELETFSYSVSHDLRAPLRSIDGFSQALLEDCVAQLDETGHDYLRRIRAATQRMGQLIDDLLTLSRVIRSDMHREVVNLSQIATQICTDLQLAHPERQVEYVIQPDLVDRGDSRLLSAMLENLLNNAWKFTAKTDRSIIEFGAIGSQSIKEDKATTPSTYFVRDNGVGFDMTYVGKLFSPFQRLHSVSEFPGNGIGLATVQRIVHRHGGRVWAEGTIGQGATFYFTLTTEEMAT
ncbi:GAF domain-containing protein [Chamaesiphon minutus]|uniref:histidine kinase n=1 Tax=Chamaesiphon minutus (strain ATCC 27169 / PCC 6605) TaxID=1173020 RepID=K9UF32_CHAP6|nr:GAF domain-containing protein [Chamaesiphon minutus]AFY93430.1 bacteriophytochrome (light-regulated signal transduction histidine kinase) [Chamaesiphon minutus PCC 6605]